MSTTEIRSGQIWQVKKGEDDSHLSEGCYVLPWLKEHPQNRISLYGEDDGSWQVLYFVDDAINLGEIVGIWHVYMTDDEIRRRCKYLGSIRDYLQIPKDILADREPVYTWHAEMAKDAEEEFGTIKDTEGKG